MGMAGITDPAQMLSDLALHNPEKEIDILNAFNSFSINQGFVDFTVLITQGYLVQNYIGGRTPASVRGSTGVYYGLRLSLVIPNSYTWASHQTQDLYNLSGNFAGGSITPLINAEIEVVDSLLTDFIPEYDIGCLVDKMISMPEFSLLFDKIFPLGMYSSVASLYCADNFPSALGFGTYERDLDGDDSEDEKDLMKTKNSQDPDNMWDRRFMRRSKNFLRREFQSNYLSRHFDNSHEEDDDGTGREWFRLTNPFADFNISSAWLSKLNWFMRRRLVEDPYDKDGNECANPVKDLF